MVQHTTFRMDNTQRFVWTTHNGSYGQHTTVRMDNTQRFVWTTHNGSPLPFSWFLNPILNPILFFCGGKMKNHRFFFPHAHHHTSLVEGNVYMFVFFDFPAIATFTEHGLTPRKRFGL